MLYYSIYMVASNNPFCFKEISPTAPFYDRGKEIKNLASYATGRANVLLYSPRRYGKTSLVRRVQRQLSEKGAVTIFADFFGVTSIDDMAARLARAVFEVTRAKEPLFKAAIRAIKSFRPLLRPDEAGGVSLSVERSAERTRGIDLLEDTMSSLGEFIGASKKQVHMALDEFQEIVEIEDGHQIEGVMMSHIQRYDASCFFVGSRRRILLAMFSDRRRPFFQSAINYELGVLPREDLVRFISERFRSAEKPCDSACAGAISDIVCRHPYYSQKLAFFVYEMSEKAVREDAVKEAFASLLESERPVFEAILQGLAPQQIALLRAIAREPAQSIFSVEYMRRHDLGSTGGAQGAIKKLSALDLIDQDEDKRWRMVDPVFAAWLER